MLLLGLAMVLKMGMKAVTQEPRPYTELMTQSLLLPNAGHFYKLAQPKQEALMLAMEEKVSPWRVMHWQGETDFLSHLGTRCLPWSVCSILVAY